MRSLLLPVALLTVSCAHQPISESPVLVDPPGDIGAPLQALFQAVNANGPLPTDALPLLTPLTAPVYVGKPSDPSLAYEPSDRDRARVGTGFTGVVAAPDGSGFARALRIAAVQPDGPLGQAGLRDGDLILGIADVRFDAAADNPIGAFRDHLATRRPGDSVEITWWRAAGEVTTSAVTLARAPASFADRATPDTWLDTSAGDGFLDRAVAAALAIDDGHDRYADTLDRNRRRLSKTDALRLPQTAQAHLRPTTQADLAREITDQLRTSLLAPVALSGGAEVRSDWSADASIREWVDKVEAALSDWTSELHAAQGWTDTERAYFHEHFHLLSERMHEGQYHHDDPNLERQRASRRVAQLLARVDRAALAQVQARVQGGLVQLVTEAQALFRDGGDGALVEHETRFGRIEVWGKGAQRHSKRCALRIDLGGDDVYRDVGGRADHELAISLSVDVAGDDVYGATTSFGQGAGIGGIGVLMDLSGDDQYLAHQWSQGVGVAGHGLLLDLGGDDVYRGQDACQGVGMVGSGVLADLTGDDVFAGVRFCQGVGLAGGVGALRDDEGDDHYSSTGRYGSEYGEPGLYSGWGQGCGFGFRHVTSGGIGMLVDGAGDDVYEAGNFSQGGAYFHAWGILRDLGGDDRYIGSRYAQGFAAHQAAGTFIDEGGDDLYQSHSEVAQGLSWDETSVVFVDVSGNDRYQTRKGFSLASAAHNGIVLFMDGAGDDEYVSRPGRANSNTYHGGHSFALFLDLGGLDRYANHEATLWNDRVEAFHEGAYHFDLPDGRLDRAAEWVRPPETDAK